MTLRPYTLAVALVGAAILPSVPQAQSFNAANESCKADVATADLVTCLSQALKASDVHLNVIYKRAMNAVDPDGQRMLIRAERTWLEYRDSNCLAERDLFDGGTAAAPAELACRQAETETRIATIKREYGWRMEKFGR